MLRVRFAPLVLLLLPLSCAHEPPPAGGPPKAEAQSTRATPEARAGAPKGPSAPRRPVVDTYHGVQVTDDYRWLEDPKNPEVKAWSDAENQLARATLDAIPERAAIKARATRLLTERSADYMRLRRAGGRLFALKVEPPKQQPMLVVLASPDDPEHARVLLDPNEVDASGGTTIDWFVPAPDGKRVAVSLSKGGSESGDVHVFDVASGKETGDVIPRVQGGTAGGSLTWKDAGSFFYTRYPRAGERPPVDLDFYQQVWFHKLGTPEGKDTYAMGKELPRIAEVDLTTSDDGRYVLASVENGDGGEYAQYLFDGKGWRRISDFADKVIAAKFAPDGSVYLLSRQGAPRGKVLRLAPGKADLAKAEPVFPEGEAVIEDVVPTKGRVYLQELVGGPSRIRSIPRAGKGEPVVLPIPPVSAVGQIEWAGDDRILLRTQSYLEPPAWYAFDGATGKMAKTALQQTSGAKMDDAEVVTEVAISKDGTKVPMSVVRPKGTKLDGTRPVLLTGYGGFGVTRSPRFRPITKLWVEQGGVFVEANLRGGGELGDAWHEAGRLTHKQNVFDDFQACAEQLVKLQYTKPASLAIMGGSNGGLLMGAALTQHPELYRAVIALVGIYDMLRVEKTPNGAFNVTEYGTVNDPEQFKALYAYSPYHRVKDGAAYPAALFMTGANDPRVDPFHSRKMVARLQAANGGSAPILLRTSADTGHGMGTPLREEIEQDADIYAFLFQQLGVTYRPVE